MVLSYRKKGKLLLLKIKNLTLLVAAVQSVISLRG